MKSAVVLISGRGSNLGAILAAGLPLRVSKVISNRPDAGGLALARAHGIATAVLDHRDYPGRPEFDAALMACIDAEAPDLVILAGFMRIFTPGLTAHYAGRMINIHPSLLPAFTGLDTHRRALEAGVKLHGATVHFVTADLDHGPIIIQAAVPVLPEDTESTLAARVLAQEHLIYPQAIRWLLEEKVELTSDGRANLRVQSVSNLALRAPQEL